MRLRLFRLLYALGAKKRLSDVLARNHQFSGIPIGTSALNRKGAPKVRLGRVERRRS